MKRTCEYNRSNKNSDKGELLKYSEFILHNRIEKKESFTFGIISCFVHSTFRQYIRDFCLRSWPFFDHLTFVIILDHLTYNPKFLVFDFQDSIDWTVATTTIQRMLHHWSVYALAGRAPHPGPPAICSGLVRVDANFALFVRSTFRRRHPSEAPFNDVFEFKSRMNFTTYV